MSRSRRCRHRHEDSGPPPCADVAAVLSSFPPRTARRSRRCTCVCFRREFQHDPADPDGEGRAGGCPSAILGEPRRVGRARDGWERRAGDAPPSGGRRRRDRPEPGSRNRRRPRAEGFPVAEETQPPPSRTPPAGRELGRNPGVHGQRRREGQPTAARDVRQLRSAVNRARRRRNPSQVHHPRSQRPTAPPPPRWRGAPTTAVRGREVDQRWG